MMMLQRSVAQSSHYKMYKAGKRWLFVCVALITFGMVSGTLSIVSADAGTNLPQQEVIEKGPTQYGLAQSSASMTTVNNLQSSVSASSLASQNTSAALSVLSSKTQNSEASNEGSAAQSQTSISSNGTSESKMPASQASSVLPASPSSEIDAKGNSRQVAVTTTTTVNG